MEIAEIRKTVEQKLSNRDYYGIFQFIDGLSERFLSTNTDNYEMCVELISQNQDLYEYLGASKQYEMAFELHNKLIKNRNRLFLVCLNNYPDLKPLYKRCVGDNSQEY